MINEILYQCGVIESLANTGLYQTISGAVRTIRKEEEVGENLVSVTAFPGSCMRSEGYADGNFDALTPDDGKTSVAFFEAGACVLTDEGRDTQLVATARLLAWYNLDRLNIGQSCYLPVDVVHATVQALTMDAAHPVKKSFIAQISVTRVMADGDHARVFGAYSFSEIPHLFTAPFAWAVYDVQIRAKYRNTCIAPVSNLCNCNIL